MTPETNDFTYFRDSTVRFLSVWSFNGITVEVYQPMGPEERADFEKHLRNERDVVEIRFIPHA